MFRWRPPCFVVPFPWRSVLEIPRTSTASGVHHEPREFTGVDPLFVVPLRVWPNATRKEVHVAGGSRAYLKEFREDTVRLYRSSGKSLITVSRELGIAVESLRK